MMKRKMLSILLALCMVCSLLPTMAFAETHHTCGDSCGHVDGDPHKTVRSEGSVWTGVSNQTELQAAATSGGNVYLTGDIVLAANSSESPTITVASGKTLNLCLNGHKLTPYKDSYFTASGEAFTVRGGATFNLTDCSTASRPGYIDANALSYRNLWKEGTSADAADITCNLIGGTITGFMSDYGAVLNAGNFTMYAGNISGNAGSYCGGVFNTGNFTMNGSSTICGNVSSGCGGGVRNVESGSITMNGGHIIHNKANYNDGGGIYLVNDSTAELNGATIQYNIAGNAGGGGVYFNGASLELSGMCTITGNRKGDADNNVYLTSGKTITVSSTGLDSGTRIGVTTQSKPAGDTTVAITGENSNDYSGCFVSDDLTSYHIENSANNVVVLKAGATSATYTVTFNANGHGTAPDAIESVTSGSTITAPTAPTADGYTFGGWYKEIACENEWEFSTDTVSANTTLYAKWTANTPITYTVTFDANGATGTAPTQSATAAGGTFTLPTATDLAKDGCTFAGWNDGTTTYAAGDTYTMPASAVTFIAQWTQNAPTPPPSGFVDGGNGMAYTYDYDSFDILGEYLKSWKQTSYDYNGYFSYLVEGEYVDEDDANEFEYDSSNGLISKTENLDAEIEITPVDGQQLLKISYTVINKSGSDKEYAVGSAVDIKIGTDDYAVVTPFTDKAGFKMLEGGENGAQFNFFGTDVTSFWYGPYSWRYVDYASASGVDAEAAYNNKNFGWPGVYANNVENAIFKSEKIHSLGVNEFLDIVSDAKNISIDSAASWRWNGTLPANESVTHSVYIGIGEVGSDDDVDIPGSDDDTPAPQPPVYYPPVDPTPVIPSVDVDIHDDTLSDAAKAVGSAVKSGKADIIPAEGYTKESIAKMQNSGELNLVIEKNAGYDEAEKKLLDDAITAKGGAAGSVMYLEIDALLMSDDGKVVAEVDDTIVPLTITVDLNDEMQKAAKEGKTIYVARAHDGKVAFIEGTLNADKTKLTFDSSKFSTYALVASDSETITSAQTADAGILLAVSMSILSVTGSAVLLKKKED